MVYIATPFPAPFAHYRPRSQKVYGVICTSPAKTLLLVRGRKTGKWSFPKGHLKGSEMAQECALRELREETGLVMEPSRFSHTMKLFAGEYFIYHMGGEMPACPEDDEEVCETGWFSYEEIHRMDVNADIKKFMRGVGYRFP